MRRTTEGVTPENFLEATLDCHVAYECASIGIVLFASWAPEPEGWVLGAHLLISERKGVMQLSNTDTAYLNT